MKPTLSRLAVYFSLFAFAIGLSQTLPSGFYLENAAGGATFNVPVGLAFASDGRIFVAEQAGMVYIIENGAKQGTPFIDLTQDVMVEGDRGLLGMALDPDFENNGYIYFLYTADRDSSGDYFRYDVSGRLVRYTASAGNPNIADLASRWVMIGETFDEGIPACYNSHAPGCLRFGTDGTLLVSNGDAANYNIVDPGGQYAPCFGPDRFDPIEDIGAFRSQYLGSLAGKILRIDPATGLGLSSNPFYTGDPTDNESKVWAYGLRNPYRFGVRQNGSTDPADGLPGSLYVGDVGWITWEDLNVVKAGGTNLSAVPGGNYGWPCYEGPNAHNGYQNATPAHSDCSGAGTVEAPALYWHHSSSGQSFPPGQTANSIIGGPFYDGAKYPEEYQGKVFYGDYGKQWMAYAEFDEDDNFVEQTMFSENIGPIVDIGYDPVSQYLHYIHIWDGIVYRIRHIDEPAVLLSLALPPSVDPVPAEGDTFSYSLTITNTTLEPELTPLFIELTVPTIGTMTIVPTKTPTIAPGAEIQKNPLVRIRSSMPAGDYNIIAHWGDSFQFNTSVGFTKSAAQSVFVDGSTQSKLESSTGQAITGKNTLGSNYPNPFNPSTLISYRLSSATEVYLRIYDINGRLIRTLIDGVPHDASYYEVSWDGKNSAGEDVASGTYIYYMYAGAFSETKTMQLIR